MVPDLFPQIVLRRFLASFQEMFKHACANQTPCTYHCFTFCGANMSSFTQARLCWMSSCLTADEIFCRTCPMPNVRSLCTPLGSGEFVIEFPHMEKWVCTSTTRVTIAVAKAVNANTQPRRTYENIAIATMKAFSAGLQRQQCQPEEER